MTHEELRASLSDLRDGEADSGTRRQLEDHLKGCGDCRAALERMQRFGEICKKTIAEPVETERFIAKYRAQTESPALWQPPWWAPALTAVATASVLVALASPDIMFSSEDLFAGAETVAEQELDLMGGLR